MTNSSFQKVWLFGLIACPIVLWGLPSDFFDDTGITTCLSRIFFNIECWGCGMTRAVMHFHHFNFEKALFFNLGVVFIYPLLVFFWYKKVIQALKKLNP